MVCKFKETRVIHPDSLRRLCVNEQWYTRGNNSEYDNLLCKMTGGKKNLTTEDMAAIAIDIIEHSSNLRMDDFERVAFELAKIAIVFIKREETFKV